MRRAFSERLQEGSVLLLDNISVPEAKTKSMVKLLNDLGLQRKTLLIVDDYEEKVDLASRNIENVLLMKAASVNVYQMLHFDNVVFTAAAIEIFTARIQ